MSPQMAKEFQRRAQVALSRSSIYDLRELTVVHTDDTLLLSGAVTSFYHKQLAQETVRAVVGEICLVNEIIVGTG